MCVHARRVLDYRLKHGPATTPPAQSKFIPLEVSSHQQKQLPNAFCMSNHPSWPNVGWQTLSQGRSVIPRFTMATMMEYFVSRTVTADLRPASDFSSISDKAYRLFKKGYVKNMEVCSPDKDDQVKQIFLRCRVHPQMKDGKYDIQIVVLAQDGGLVKEIEWASCGCPAGKAPYASCKHLAAAFYALEEFCRLGYAGDELSCTSKLKEWNIPRKHTLDIHPAENFDLSRPKLPASTMWKVSRKCQPRQKVSFFRDPRPRCERGTVQSRLWPALDELEKSHSQAGILLVYRKQRQQMGQQQIQRLKRRDKLQEPFLRARTSYSDSVATHSSSLNSISVNSNNVNSNNSVSSSSSNVSTKSSSINGFSDLAWLTGQTSFITHCLAGCATPDTPEVGLQEEKDGRDECEKMYDWPKDDDLCSFSQLVFSSFSYIRLLASKQKLVKKGQDVLDFRPGPVKWGGKLGDIHFDNTCPVDNFLTICWVAVHNSSFAADILFGDTSVRFSRCL